MVMIPILNVILSFTYENLMFSMCQVSLLKKALQTSSFALRESIQKTPNSQEKALQNGQINKKYTIIMSHVAMIIGALTGVV